MTRYGFIYQRYDRPFSRRPPTRTIGGLEGARDFAALSRRSYGLDYLGRGGYAPGGRFSGGEGGRSRFAARPAGYDRDYRRYWASAYDRGWW